MDGVQLLRSVAEQLKVPLSLIARQAELGQLTGTMHVQGMETIEVHASAALSLVDCYLLGLQLARQQMKLDFEPVSVSSLLVEVAHELEPLAAQYQTDVQVQIGGKYEPVMAHRAGFKAALTSLGYAFLSGQQAVRRNVLTLAVHRNTKGIVTGMYSTSHALNADSWRRALELAGSATKPLSSLTGSSAGLFVSASIFSAMSSELKASKYQRQQGLAAILQPSHQLAFV